MKHELSRVLLDRPGRMISGSKSGYMSQCPDNMVVFNANICRENGIKVWHGDLDIDRDADDLRALSVSLDAPLLVLREMDARFQHECAPRLDAAVARITADGVTIKQRDGTERAARAA